MSTKSIALNGNASRHTSTPQPSGLLPAAIYARVSTTEQADKGYSLPTQIDACQAMARQEGYTVPESYIFVDDYTGTTLHRPQLTPLRDLVRQRLVQAVIVHDPDRLSRKLAHQLLLSEEFEQAGVALRIVARFLRRDSVSSIAYSEELISDTISATLQSTDRHYGIVDQEPDHFRRDS